MAECIESFETIVTIKSKTMRMAMMAMTMIVYTQAAFLKEHEPSSAVLAAAGPLLPLVIAIIIIETRLLAGGPSGLLTSSFAPFGRSGRYIGPA